MVSDLSLIDNHPLDSNREHVAISDYPGEELQPNDNDLTRS